MPVFLVLVSVPFVAVVVVVAACPCLKLFLNVPSTQSFQRHFWHFDKFAASPSQTDCKLLSPTVRNDSREVVATNSGNGFLMKLQTDLRDAT